MRRGTHALEYRDAEEFEVVHEEIGRSQEIFAPQDTPRRGAIGQPQDGQERMHVLGLDHDAHEQIKGRLLPAVSVRPADLQHGEQKRRREREQGDGVEDVLDRHG